MNRSLLASRRGFLKTSILGTVGAALGPSLAAVEAVSTSAVAARPRARVALTIGTDRSDVVFRGLRPFADEIRNAIGSRRVLIKPNNVAIDTPLCATHVDSLQGILEFLKSIGKLNEVVIAESAAGGPTLDGFANYGYTRLTSSSSVKLVDLDQQGVELVHVFDETDFQPHAVRMSKALLDPDTFVISAARMKTHDRVVATLSLKNIVFGAPIKDEGFRWGAGSRAGARIDKPIAHGGGFRGINYNLFALAPRLHPHLSVIDGVEGMQGNGPVGGTPVDHRVCVVSTDWLAADRVAVELMGIDFGKIGYLNYCSRAGLGQGDLARIDVLGPNLADHIKPYRLHDNIEQQLVWRKAAA